jgi:hypothetical protein
MLRKGSGDAMTTTRTNQVCAARAADVLLRAMGGCSVRLRMPAPAVPADPTEQLGLATPLFQDLTLSPAVCREARATVSEGKAAKWELLVSATAVEELLGSLAYASASVLFANACGVLTDEGAELLEIVSATQEPLLGRPYVYRLLLRAPLAVSS